MAFFSAGGKEYFSFSFEPNGNKKSYVFSLSQKQSYISRLFIPILFFISISIFSLVVYFVFLESMGMGFDAVGENYQELVILALSGCACIIVFFEFLLFLWIKRRTGSLLSEKGRRELKEIVFLKNKSLMAYFIFLFCMTMPLISLGALPGGFAKFFAENLAGKNGWLFFLSQLIMFYFFLVFLILRAITHINKK